MGQPVVHWEFWSEDPARIADFYQKVFAWNISAIPELNYRLVETGGQGGIDGGIMKPQAGPWPGKLAFYIDVDDIDRFSEKFARPEERSFWRRPRYPASVSSPCSRIPMDGCSACGSK